MPILDESRMSLTEAAAFCRREVQTIRLWIKTGFRGTKLEAVKIGGSVVTSREAINRFIAATNQAKGK